MAIWGKKQSLRMKTVGTSFRNARSTRAAKERLRSLAVGGKIQNLILARLSRDTDVAPGWPWKLV